MFEEYCYCGAVGLGDTLGTIIIGLLLYGFFPYIIFLYLIISGMYITGIGQDLSRILMGIGIFKFALGGISFLLYSCYNIDLISIILDFILKIIE